MTMEFCVRYDLSPPVAIPSHPSWIEVGEASSAPAFQGLLGGIFNDQSGVFSSSPLYLEKLLTFLVLTPNSNLS